MKRTFCTAVPRVVILISTDAPSNRAKLAGIFRYVRLHTPWNIRLIDRADDARTVSDIRKWRPSGMIIGRMLETVKGNLNFGIPSVVMDAKRKCYVDLLRRSSFISCDQGSVVEAGAKHLVKRGFVRFAYLADGLKEWSEERGQLFSAWAKERGFPCAVYVSRRRGSKARSDDWMAEQDELMQWLKSLPERTAIFVSNDRQAREVLEFCQLARISVPSELAVLGCDNDALVCENTMPALSSVEPDFEMCGYRAAELLERLMSRVQRGPQYLSYGVKRLIERESDTFQTRTPDPRVSMGLEFIRLNAARGIGVCDVAAHMRVSRRMAELLFRKQMGSSINAEIQRVRVERLKGFLQETDRSITVLCQQSGYTNDAHVKKLFKQLTGETMSHFRSSHRNHAAEVSG